MQASTGEARPGRGRRAWLCALLPALGFGAWHWRDPPPLEASDYAQYLLHAKALVEGRRYADIGYLYSGLCAYVGPPAEPPGLPLTLAPVLALGGPVDAEVKALMLALSLAFLAIAGAYFAERDRWLAAAVVLLIAASSPFVTWSTVAISDFGFSALVWGVILLYDRDRPFGPARAAAATALTAAAIAYRAVGVALLPAMLIHAIRHRKERGRLLALPPVLLGALGLGAVLFGAARFVPGAAAGHVQPLEFLRQSVQHLLLYRLAVSSLLLSPLPWPRANDAWHLAAGLVLLLGLVRWVIRYPFRLSTLFSASMMAVLAVAPVFSPRYLWPLYPLLAFAFFDGIAEIAARVLGRPAEKARAAALIAAGALALVALTQYAGEPDPPGLIGEPAAADLFAYLRRLAAQEPIRVSFFNPRVLTWETGVPAMCTVFQPPERVVAELQRQRVTHLVLGSLGRKPEAEAAGREAVRAHPELFTLAWRNPRFDVYRFRGDPAVR